jgi:hypothetical protein
LSFLKIFVNLFHFNRTNWKAVALCFIAATVFWLFNALNKTYSTLVRFPLQFEYDQGRYAAAQHLPETLPVNVSGNGWDLFRKTFGVKLPVLTLPLEQPTEIKRIVAGSLPALLSGQMNNLVINSVAIDTLRIQIDRRTTRKFRLKADLSEISFRENLGRTSPVVLLPDSVTLDGPESLLQKMPDTIQLKLPAKKLNGNYRNEVEVLLPNSEFIKRNPPVVEAIFEVDEMMEELRVIPIQLPALPWGISAEEDSVQCRISYPKKNQAVMGNLVLFAALNSPTPPQKKGEIKSYYPSVSGLLPHASVLQIDSVHLKKH